MIYLRLVLLVCFVQITGSFVQAQSLPVGSIGLEDLYRRNQLNGTGDSSVSHTIRPLYAGFQAGTESLYFPDSGTRQDMLKLGYTRWITENGKFKISILPLDLRLRLNSHHPYGSNDGPMIPAKGLQTMVSGGLFAEYGILSVQLKPEILLAANPSFEGFTKEHYDVIAARYYDFYNFTDLPQRFGKDPYSTISWGQSSIRLNYKGISLGLSNENLWWGPGIQSSLLMSNTAPGFKHLSLNTSKPLKTRVGSFEGQLIAGRLEGSGFNPLTPGRSYLGDSLYLPKPDDWRYLSGLALTWQPKWVPGLFFGFTRSFQRYNKDVKSRLGDYLPVFFPLQRLKTDDAIVKRDQSGSLFMRWLWPEEEAEFYFEYGRSSGSGNMRDLLLEPQNNRAYLFGLRKQLPFRARNDEHILLGLEVTQLQQSVAKAALGIKSWYTNKYIRHGYTHMGESLGAGIGPGGGLQSLDVSWVKGLKRIGLQLERYVHNNDFYYYAYIDSQDWRRHWVDLSIAASGEWDYKNLLFSARVQHVSSINYQWYLLQTDPEQYFTNGLDRSNVQVQLGFSYRF